MCLTNTLGFVLAIASMTLYGLYMVPRKKSSIPQGVYTFWMGCGILISTFIIGMLSGNISRVNVLQYAMIFGSGLLWATGTDAYCRAVRSIGLSRSTPIKNTSAILGTLFGIIFFSEFSLSGALPVAFALLGSISIVVSATILGRLEVTEIPGHCCSEQSKSPLYGILYSIWAAGSYSAYTIPMKIVYTQGITPSSFLFYMGQGCFVGMAVIAYLSRTRSDAPVTWRDRNLAQISGAMWALGSLCANVAIKMIGVAIAWPITKNTVVAVLFGVLVLKEIDAVRHKKDLRLGLVLSVLGVALLAFATVHR